MSAINAFKVIIVGGGPVGLTAAHAFSRAGIPFTLLERRESTIVDAGSNLVLLQVGMRALGQLDLLKDLDKVSTELHSIRRLDHSGKDLGNVDYFKYSKEQFGIWPRVFSRHDLTKVLYETLPESAKASILTNKKVSSIETTPEGVNVSCADGTSYAGSIVVGADGAHSMVRSCMRNLAIETKSTDVNDEQPFLTTYRCIWIRFPTNASPLLYEGLTTETHGTGAATQLFAGEETGVTGVYERLPAPTRDRIRYTQADEEDLVKTWGHLPLLKGDGQTKNFTLGDAYSSCVSSGLVSLEEGVIDHWSFDSRIVLTGDSKNKFTPSTGSGCNNGIIDVVVLANELHKIARSSTPGSSLSPTRAQIGSAFKAYQDTRFEAALAVCQESGNVTNMATWGTGVHKFVDRYVIGWPALQKFLSSKVSAPVARTPRFDFVVAEEKFAGSVPWEKPMPTTVEA